MLVYSPTNSSRDPLSGSMLVGGRILVIENAVWHGCQS